MANLLPDFPEEILICILSFLTPSEIAAFSCTSKRFFSLCRSDSRRLWHALCHRRWSHNTQINTWGKGKISYKLLYNILSQWDGLIGVWRRSGHPTAAVSSPPLVVFEWGPSFITGSRVCGTTPFLRMSVTEEGQIENLVDLGGGTLVPVGVSLVGSSHLVVDEKVVEDMEVDDRSTWEAYEYFANRRSPGTERRRQRKRKKWEMEHFVKIVNCSSTMLITNMDKP